MRGISQQFYLVWPSSEGFNVFLQMTYLTYFLSPCMCSSINKCSNNIKNTWFKLSTWATFSFFLTQFYAVPNDIVTQIILSQIDTWINWYRNSYVAKRITFLPIHVCSYNNYAYGEVHVNLYMCTYQNKESPTLNLNGLFKPWC